MFLFLLLGAFAVGGLCSDSHSETYGRPFSLRLSRSADSLDFFPDSAAGRVVLWRRDDPQTETGSYYRINNVTQRDSGRYVVKDRHRNILLQRHLEVKAETADFSLNPGDSFSVSSVLSGLDCNVFFFPDGGHDGELLVHRGRMEDQVTCTGLSLRAPCKLVTGWVKHACEGRFEFRDQEENTALEATLDVEDEWEREMPYTLALFGAVGLLILVPCVKMCCIRKSSRDKTETPQEEENRENRERTVPDYYYECRHERFRPRVETDHEPPAQPSAPLIHCPPIRPPPAYSESPSAPPGPDLVPQSQVPPSAEPPSYSQVMSEHGPVLFPLNSGPDLRFEVGAAATFDPAAPLTSHPESAVYTSDKLNFL